jgi:hypothetical protein
MTLKNASLLALVGTALVSLLMLWNLISNVLNVARGLIPVDTLLSSLIHTFGYLTIVVFFYVFYKEQR